MFRRVCNLHSSPSMLTLKLAHSHATKHPEHNVRILLHTDLHVVGDCSEVGGGRLDLDRLDR